MGITQGRILLPSLNLSFEATSHGQYRDLDRVSRRLAPSAEEGYRLRRGIGGEPLEFEPILSSRHGYALGSEIALGYGLFQFSADIREEFLPTTRQDLVRLGTSPVPRAANGVN